MSRNCETPCISSHDSGRPVQPAFSKNADIDHQAGAFRVLLCVLCEALLACNAAWPSPVRVRYREGETHGFLVLRTLDGKRLAAGDELQIAQGDRVRTELIFRFEDHSLYDETTVFSQRATFRLLSDHLVEKGPAFPHPMEVDLNAMKGLVTIRSEKGGKEKLITKRLRVPADTANGMTDLLLMNMDPGAPQTLSYVTPSSSPRVVKLEVSPHGKDPFFAGGWKFRAIHYVIKIRVGGVAGAVAPLIGKKPPDMNVWILGGSVPAFVRFDGTLYDGGPIWRIERAAPVWPHIEENRSP